ncbi:piwi-like protein 1 isoform X2 [Ictalurus furcatus]|uniref:piwi-like protein 1 isoform X2 n=1 Tax=Ictalurus furcatus TaxID=66913 RepID=UPI0023500BA9|nr:piwi-like protein 1 isoform X2 [Ictalurus furcatus]
MEHGVVTGKLHIECTCVCVCVCVYRCSLWTLETLPRCHVTLELPADRQALSFQTQEFSVACLASSAQSRIEAPDDIGIDCYHDSAAGKRSIGALVASLNPGMSRKMAVTLQMSSKHH